ncbi:MAG: hypothetical protein AABZ00_19645 [Chloroflexota bacterium]|jgi:hypothetical protein
MRWMNVRKTYPNQWLVIEAVKAHSAKTKRVLDKISVLESCNDGVSAMQQYRKLHKKYPEREFYFVHTSRSRLDIYERQWLGIRRGHATSAQR